MPKFHAYGKVVGTKYLGEFVAETADEARRIAEKAAWASMCHQCSSECSDPEITEIEVEPVDPSTSASQ